MKEKYIQGKVSWYRACESLQEATLLAEEPQKLKKLGKRSVKVNRDNKVVNIYQGEFRKVIYDKIEGTWGVTGEEATLDEKQIADRKNSEKDEMEIFHELYQKDLEKGKKKNGKAN